MKIDKESLRKPEFWAVVVPAVLVIGVMITGSKLMGSRRQALREQERAEDVARDVRVIRRVMERAGAVKEDTTVERAFDPASSAAEAAAHAGINPMNIRQGSASSPSQQKDGRFLHRENYRLTSVKLLQIAIFVDYCERQFDSVTCTSLNLSPIRSRSKDSWEATVDIQYLRERPI